MLLDDSPADSCFINLDGIIFKLPDRIYQEDDFIQSLGDTTSMYLPINKENMVVYCHPLIQVLISNRCRYLKTKTCVDVTSHAVRQGMGKRWENFKKVYNSVNDKSFKPSVPLTVAVMAYLVFDFRVV